MSLHEGEVILKSKYRIVKLLGEGACARVWLAEEPEFAGRQVAIKELKREALTPTELEEQERRFRQEVEMAAQLGQARVPHVIRAITLEHLEDGTRLLVMELAEGGSLADRIAQHPDGMAIEEAVQITLDLCQALQAFHDLESSPVHRDVKPSNILFDRQGNAYLADFGLCQLPGQSGRTQMEAGPHPATPLYAAPEQLRSPEPLTPAADIFALGCVLFEMLTGKPYKRVRPGTKPGALRSELPGWLDGVVAKTVAENQWDRYQEAAELRTALGDHAQTQRKTEPPDKTTEKPEERERRERKKRTIVWPLALGGTSIVACIVVIVGVTWGMRSCGTESIEMARATATLTAVQALVHTAAPAQTPTQVPTPTPTRTPTQVPTPTATRTQTYPTGRIETSFTSEGGWWQLTARDIVVQPDNTFRVNVDIQNQSPFNEVFDYIEQLDQVFVVDNLGKQYNVVRSGGVFATATKFSSYETLSGWLIFPAFQSSATDFFFYHPAVPPAEFTIEAAS